MRLCLALMFALILTGEAHAQMPFDAAPYKAELTMAEPWGSTTYRFWIDRGAVNEQDPNRPYSWQDLQQYCRLTGFNCFLTFWGESEVNRFRNARDARDLNYTPLLNQTFIPINVIISTSAQLSPNARPVWRQQTTDSLVIELRDGRRLIGDETKPVKRPEISLRIATTGQETACQQFHRTLTGTVLFTREELHLLVKAQPIRYGDKPTANIFLVPVPNGGKDFSLRDITRAYLTFRGQRVVLGLNPAMLPKR